MASSGRRTDPSLEEALFECGYEFEFFQAVRLLARMFPERKAVGKTARPQEEFARFGAQLSMAFPPSAVHEIEQGPDPAGPARLTVAFFGLTGTQGILPLCYTEWMIARDAAKDDTLEAFFDLFNHRLLSLFYRAWEKHHPPVLYELSAVRDQRPDPFTHSLFDIIGMGTNGLRGRMRVQDESLLLYAGLIAQRPHSAWMVSEPQPQPMSSSRWPGSRPSLRQSTPAWRAARRPGSGSDRPSRRTSRPCWGPG